MNTAKDEKLALYVLLEQGLDNMKNSRARSAQAVFSALERRIEEQFINERSDP